MPKRRRQPAPPPSWDMGAAGPANRLRLVEEPRGVIDETGRLRNPNGVRGVRRQSIVDLLFVKGRLTVGQIAVARELRDAYEGRVEADPLAALVIDRPMHSRDAQAALVDARAKFRIMWAKVPVGAKPVLEHVVLEDKPMRALGGRYARSLARLRYGLDAIRG